jgi:hypothetical protein
VLHAGHNDLRRGFQDNGANIQTFRNVLGFGVAKGKQKQKTKQNNQPPVQPSPQSSSPLTPMSASVDPVIKVNGLERASH